MIKVYLFDWGDTLMVDFPDVSGKMCDWEIVEATPGAKETLAALAKRAKIYVATGAADSTAFEIQRAFERVGLSPFISGYFCKANIGVSKGTPEFLHSILAKLQIPAENIAMVGDNFEKDIKPAIAAGIQPIWLTNNETASVPENIKVIRQLKVLCS